MSGDLPGQDTEPQAAGRIRALVVDDEATSRDILENMLNEIAIVETVESGIQAIGAVTASLVNRKPYDLITMDISMPGMDGIEALRIIRTVELEFGDIASSKILMATSSTQHQHIVDSYNYKCEGFLFKPFSVDEMHAKLRVLGLCHDDAA